MRFMLIQNYGGVELETTPMNEWTPEEIQAHIAFQMALNSELGESGEFVDAQALSGPDQAKFVLSTVSAHRSSPTDRFQKARSCLPAIESWTSSRRSVPSRSPPGSPPHPDGEALRSASGSRFAR